MMDRVIFLMQGLHVPSGNYISSVIYQAGAVHVGWERAPSSRDLEEFNRWAERRMLYLPILHTVNAAEGEKRNQRLWDLSHGSTH